MASRVIYILVGVSAIYEIAMLSIPANCAIPPKARQCHSIAKQF